MKIWEKKPRKGNKMEKQNAKLTKMLCLVNQ